MNNTDLSEENKQDEEHPEENETDDKPVVKTDECEEQEASMMPPVVFDLTKSPCDEKKIVISKGKRKRKSSSLLNICALVCDLTKSPCDEKNYLQNNERILCGDIIAYPVPVSTPADIQKAIAAAQQGAVAELQASVTGLQASVTGLQADVAALAGLPAAVAAITAALLLCRMT